MNVPGIIDPDLYDRVAKLLVDDGTAATFEEAHAVLRTYRLQLVAGHAACHSEAWQAALLTAVNTATRAVHGGVTVILADRHARMRVRSAACGTLAEALTALGATVARNPEPDIPTIYFAEARARDSSSAPSLHVAATQWTAGAGPEPPSSAAAAHPLSAMIAAALAVSECFQWLRGYVVAGERAVGISLWQPELDWLDPAAEGPPIRELPAAAWLLGLGHLGQATAWLMSLLPYSDEDKPQLVLHDNDRITPANRATSMFVTGENAIGRRKARLIADALERRFDTVVIEHRYEGGQLRQPGDPDLLLAGVDNPATRRLLDETGFSVICDAGLGAGPDGFLAMQLRRLPAARPSAEIWASDPRARHLHDELSAYRKLEQVSGDRCGVERLAGRTVATAFVGVVAAGCLLGGVVRELHGGTGYGLIDLDLREPNDVVAIPSQDSRRIRLATIRAREVS